ncbi:hypothetical protein AVEN_237948-1 [Araneus ventricosus]|uniref:Uncharacterized protein n=1 Tax=Araneus ventricosus TaxID=182803 RepID=A0A4Y2QQF0_ARAVE|nr:hypothetical protein AVEN_237948-1 [Araneus ventricosus]
MVNNGEQSLNFRYAFILRKVSTPEPVFEVIKSSKFLPENLLKVIDQVIQRNAFFAYPGNLILSAIVDKRDHIRELGFGIIIKARNLASKRKSIRSFQPPKINFLATDYIEMIHWNTVPDSNFSLQQSCSNLALQNLQVCMTRVQA